MAELSGHPLQQAGPHPRIHPGAAFPQQAAGLLHLPTAGLPHPIADLPHPIADLLHRTADRHLPAAATALLQAARAGLPTATPAATGLPAVLPAHGHPILPAVLPPAEAAVTRAEAIPVADTRVAEAAVAAAEDGDRQISPNHPETPNDYHPRQNYSGGWSHCPRTIQNYLTI